jgi:hypothetical protein
MIVYPMGRKKDGDKMLMRIFEGPPNLRIEKSAKIFRS